MSSQLFSAYHAIGLYSQEIPFAILSRGKQHIIAIAIDDAFHLYSLDTLQLLFVGYAKEKSEFKSEDCIQRLLFHNGRLYVAQGANIRVWKNGRVIGSHPTQEPVNLLMGCGDKMLSAEGGGAVKVWECGDVNKLGEEFLHIELDPTIFKVTALLHPNTYVNKVLLGSHQGSLQLWNIRRNSLVFEFKGWGSPILSLEQSPSLDVIAAGLMDGSIRLHDIKFDRPVMRFSQDSPVTALSFRADEDPVLVSGSVEGQISVWDLEKERLRGVVEDAHSARVTSLSFVGSQAVAVSASTDNSIKMWVFDEPDGLPRLLRSRSGHASPPSRIRFFSPGGLALLSASQDGSFRIFSLVRSASLELSQGHTLSQSRRRGVTVESLRLPALTDFSVEMSRAEDWDCIASVHAGLPWVQTWHLFRRSVGQHKIRPPHGENAVPTCVCSSPCGHYVAVGDSCGHVELFNIQSGIHRGCFEMEPGVSGAHKGPVRGVAINATCRVLYSVGADGVLRFWNLSGYTLAWKLPFKMSASRLLLHRSSGLLAVVLDDFSVRIVDADTHRVVRIFHTHSQPTDLVVSPDARWLIVALSDATVRTWDLPTGRLIDCFRVESPVTSLAMSPTGEALATAHADSPGVFVWSNKTMYERVSLMSIDEASLVPSLQLPRAQAEIGGRPEEGGEGEGEGQEENRGEELDYGEYNSPSILDSELLGLSGLSKSHWLTLSKLDVIKERNKPTDPVLKPKPAPFFLPTQPDLSSFTFLPPDTVTNETPSRIKTRPVPEASSFLKLLISCQKTADYSPLLDQLKEMGPAAIDAELRLLGSEVGSGGLDELDSFLDFLLASLQTRQDFELIQAVMETFLRVHLTVLTANGDIFSDKLARLKERLSEVWSGACELMRFSLCMINIFKRREFF